MAQDSPNWRMANRLAGGQLDTIVAHHVNDDRSWQWIADRLRDDYGIEVTRVTLTNWYKHLSPATGGKAGAA